MAMLKVHTLLIFQEHSSNVHSQQYFMTTFYLLSYLCLYMAFHHSLAKASFIIFVIFSYFSFCGERSSGSERQRALLKGTQLVMISFQIGALVLRLTTELFHSSKCLLDFSIHILLQSLYYQNYSSLGTSLQIDPSIFIQINVAIT